MNYSSKRSVFIIASFYKLPSFIKVNNTMSSSLPSGLLHGVSFIQEDVLSAAPRQRLRSDAVAVGMQMAFEQALSSLQSNDSTISPELIKQKFCIIDPNVIYLMVSSQTCRLGPVDDMIKASKIFVPIANFDTTTPEGGYHWTLLVLEKDFSSSSTNSSTNDNNNEQNDSNCSWFPPVHIDSLSHSSASSATPPSSSNQAMAERTAGLIIGGLANNNNNKVSTRNISAVLHPTTPQQKNGLDCGIFIALAVKNIVDIILRKSSIKEYVEGKRSIFFVDDEEETQDNAASSVQSKKKRTFVGENAPWNYDQSVATRFKEDLFMAMSAAIKKR